MHSIRVIQAEVVVTLRVSHARSSDARKLIGRGEHAGPVVMEGDRQLGERRGEDLVARLRVVVRHDRGLVAEALRFEDALVAAVYLPGFMRAVKLYINFLDGGKGGGQNRRKIRKHKRKEPGRQEEYEGGSRP